MKRHQYIAIDKHKSIIIAAPQAYARMGRQNSIKEMKKVELNYKKASVEDIELLVRTRIIVLRTVNNMADDADMSEVEERSREYYMRCFDEDIHAAYLVLDGDRFVGAGGISFYEVMPTGHNPSGRKAYLMNIYTDPSYRRRGIAMHVLDLLVGEALDRGIEDISLEATPMGRPLYEKYGFEGSPSEMHIGSRTLENAKIKMRNDGLR